VEVRIAFSDLDVRTVVTTHALIKKQFRESGTGELIYNEKTLAGDVLDKLRSFDSAAHHAGTTRMSADQRNGVVDKNCRVHGTQNLFVAGSSVFPTSSHANPTLTIVTLALRLAAHVKKF
jgi:choline dehydrogenase-like flavoprotein